MESPSQTKLTDTTGSPAEPTAPPRPARKVRRVLIIFAVIAAIVGGAYILTAGAGEPRLLHTLGGHTIAVRGLVFTPDGRTLVSCGQEGTVKLWDTASGTETATLRSKQEGILGAALAPDGKTLATGGTDQTTRLWDLTSQRLRDTLPSESWVRAVAFSPDGRTVAVGSAQSPDEDAEKAFVQLWTNPGGHEGLQLRGHGKGDIMALRFTRDGKTLLSASTDRSGGVGWWDVGSAKLLARTPAHTGGVLDLALSPDGTRLVSAGQDRTLRVWDVASRKVVNTLTGHGGSITCVSFNPDGKMLASGDIEGVVKFWDAATGQELDSFRAHDDWVGVIAYSPDGAMLATARGNPTQVTGTEPPPAEVKLWRLPSGLAGGRP